MTVIINCKLVARFAHIRCSSFRSTVVKVTTWEVEVDCGSNIRGGGETKDDVGWTSSVGDQELVHRGRGEVSK